MLKTPDEFPEEFAVDIMVFLQENFEVYTVYGDSVDNAYNIGLNYIVQEGIKFCGISYEYVMVIPAEGVEENDVLTSIQEAIDTINDEIIATFQDDSVYIEAEVLTPTGRVYKIN